MAPSLPEFVCFGPDSWSAAASLFDGPFRILPGLGFARAPGTKALQSRGGRHRKRNGRAMKPSGLRPPKSWNSMMLVRCIGTYWPDSRNSIRFPTDFIGFRPATRHVTELDFIDAGVGKTAVVPTLPLDLTGDWGRLWLHVRARQETVRGWQGAPLLERDVENCRNRDGRVVQRQVLCLAREQRQPAGGNRGADPSSVLRGDSGPVPMAFFPPIPKRRNWTAR